MNDFIAAPLSPPDRMASPGKRSVRFVWGGRHGD